MHPSRDDRRRRPGIREARRTRPDSRAWREARRQAHSTRPVSRRSPRHRSLRSPRNERCSPAPAPRAASARILINGQSERSECRRDEGLPLFRASVVGHKCAQPRGRPLERLAVGGGQRVSWRRPGLRFGGARGLLGRSVRTSLRRRGSLFDESRDLVEPATSTGLVTAPVGITHAAIGELGRKSAPRRSALTRSKCRFGSVVAAEAFAGSYRTESSCFSLNAFTTSPVPRMRPSSSARMNWAPRRM